MHICMSNDVTFTSIAIVGLHNFSFTHVMLNFPDGMNKVFELNRIYRVKYPLRYHNSTLLNGASTSFFIALSRVHQKVV